MIALVYFSLKLFCFDFVQKLLPAKPLLLLLSISCQSFSSVGTGFSSLLWSIDDLAPGEKMRTTVKKLRSIPFFPFSLFSGGKMK